MATDEERLNLIESRANLIGMALRANGPASSYESEDWYFVSAWEHDRPYEQAVDLARDPLTIYLALTLGRIGLGLEAVLADRHASAGLKKCLVENHEGVRKALAQYVVPPKPKGQRGPRPFKDGKHKTTLAEEMFAQGSTLQQIAREFYGDPSQTKRVKALLARPRTKAPKPTRTEK